MEHVPAPALMINMDWRVSGCYERSYVRLVEDLFKIIMIVYEYT